MAKRREVVRVAGGRLPEGLEPIRASSYPAGGSESARSVWHAARTARRAARGEFLASVTVRPDGVAVGEFLQAHRFIFYDRGAEKVAHLTL